MLDRAALDVDEAGDADPDRCRRAGRRWRRAAPRRPGRRCGPRRRRRARSARGPRRRIAPASSRTSPRVLVAPMSRPSVHRSHPASRSSSVTAAAAGARVAARADPSGSGPSYGPGQPHSTTTAAPAVHDLGPAVRVAHLQDDRTVGRRAVSPGATKRSGVSPHGTSPTAMLAAVATLTISAPRQVGQLALDDQRRRAHRRAGVAASTAYGAALAQPVEHPRRSGRPPPRGAPRVSRPASTAATIAAWISRTRATRLRRRRCRAGRRRRRATARRPPGCRGRRTRRPCRGRR